MNRSEVSARSYYSAFALCSVCTFKQFDRGYEWVGWLAGRCKEHWVGCPCCQRSEKLFQDTPDDKKLCYVKEEVFEITDGGPIIDTDHPVIKEMFEIPIAGVLCCSLNLYGLLLFVHFCVLHFRHHSTDAVVWSHFSHHSTDAVVWA